MKPFYFLAIYFTYHVILLASPVNEFDKTIYAWSVSKKSKYNGKCYEIDKETFGEKYTYKVRKELCRPVKTEFLWVQHLTKHKGNCYIVDSKTKGNGYSQRTSKKKCYPKTYNYYFLKESDTRGSCIMVDLQTGGKTFSIKTKDKYCSQDKMAFRFELDKKGKSGRCYKYDIKTSGENFIKKVATKNCKTKNIDYVFNKNPLTNKGVCYEVDAINGPASYIKKTKPENCYKNKNEKNHSWIIENEHLKDGCYEVGKTLQNEPYSRLVSNKHCRPDQTTKLFLRLSTTRGNCYEIDVETYGKKYKNKLPIKSCRPKEYHTRSINNDCYYVDKETGGERYVEQTQIKYCLKEELVSKHVWIPNIKTQWKGHCEKVINKKQYVTLKRHCKPKRTAYEWHNDKPFSGKCYEVHYTLGPDGYVSPTKRKNCLPIKTKYFFYKRKGHLVGTCYLVDNETSGEKYYKVEKGKLCAKNLL